MTPARVVSPYRPFPPESEPHRELGAFDWVAALQMLRSSVVQTMAIDTIAITDRDTDLPVPSFKFKTKERRLMLWILEVSLRYLESQHFDRDTILVSPDILVLDEIRHWFTADLGVLVRLEDKYVQADLTILNQVQWWRVSAKDRLVAFYAAALELARTLPEHLITWGADTVPLQRLLEPLELGHVTRGCGLSVSMISASWPLEALSAMNIRRLEDGLTPRVRRPILDFRSTRKRYMKAAYEALVATEVPA